MKYTAFSISVESPADLEGAFAAKILCDEINSRFSFSGEGGTLHICFERAEMKTKDHYAVKTVRGGMRFLASSIRGYIFAIGLFLRKSVPLDGGFSLVCDIAGDYAPEKSVRGHQLGYRPLNNTYDMWDVADFDRYYLDIMFFGANTVEHIPYAKGESTKKDFMKYDELDLLKAASADAAKLGLDVSLWYPNCEKDLAAAIENRRKVFAETPDIDYVFPPGADPGDLPVPELFRWLKAISDELRNTHPGAKMTPSAQMPHDAPGWGEEFIAEMEKRPDFIDQVVQGPNRAFTTEQLRRRLPAEYPVRLYPDITHNVRCETPVHFDRDDWHYAWAAALSRESINPRPNEYAKFHYLQSPYTVGSVTYSEGVNDDINKAVWCALEWDPRMDVREILCDYARLYLPGADADTVADAIFGLENNWLTSPSAATGAEYTCRLWEELAEKTPALRKNWRWQSGAFRAVCDLFIRKKKLASDKAVSEAKALIKKGETQKALQLLEDFRLPAEAVRLRARADELADDLYHSVGIQLSVEKYNADGVERGAVLDTLDLPVSDAEYLTHICRRELANEAEEGAALTAATLTDVPENGFSWFLAVDGLDTLGETQTPDFYMDFQGDHPGRNDGTLPVCCMKLFDHYRFALSAGGLNGGGDYVLTVIYRDAPSGEAAHHKIEVNGKTLYDGVPFGGVKNEKISSVLPAFLTARDYNVPAGCIENGCVRLIISEPTSGCEIAGVVFREKV